MHYKIRTYSKGMKQRLGIAQALMHEPEVIFLDEPTDGVDPVGRREIRELMQDLKQRGTTMFLNSHLLGEVELICDRVAILDHISDGRLNFGIAATPAATQNTLGAAQCFTRGAAGGVLNLANQGCDPAGFPNGRRPADDVTDITLRVAEGFLAPTGDAAAGGAAIVDGAFIGTASSFQAGFPYLNTPYGGSP